MSAWPLRSVASLARYVNGYPFKPEDHSDDGLPIIRIKQLNDPDATPDYYEGFIPSRFHIADGDLIFSWSGSLSVKTWDRGPALLNQHLFRVEPYPGVDKSWLRWALEDAIIEFSAHMHGSAMTHITQPMMREVRIPLPPLEEQRRIANYLDDQTARMDQAIQLRQRQIQLARARFEESVRQEIAVLSQAWSRVDLRRVLRGVSTGTTPHETSFASDGLPWYSPESLDTLGRLLIPKKHLRWPVSVRQPVFPQKSVLVVGIGATAGRVAVLDHAASANQQLTALIPGEQMDPHFLMWQLHVRRAEFLATAPFTTLPILNNSFIGSIRVVAPAFSIQAKASRGFQQQAEAVRLLAATGRTAVGLLEHRRASLITAAVSGELSF